MVTANPELILSLLLLTGMAQTEAIQCQVKNEVVVVQEEHTASLPCNFQDFKSPEKLVVSWQLADGDNPILVLGEYGNGTRDNSQDQRFAKRTCLPSSWANSGNATLEISRVQVKDSGNYTCLVREGDRYKGRHKTCALLELLVNSGASRSCGGALCAAILLLFLTKVST